MSSQESPSYAEFIWRTESENAVRVRGEIEEWLLNIKDEVTRRGIETYLKREDNQQVRGAYFELYLHQRLINNGFDIEYHPSNDANKPPDFISLIDGVPQFYMEATVHKPGTLDEDLFPKDSNPLEAILLKANDSIERKLKKKGGRYSLDELPFILAIDVLEGFFGLDEAEDQLASLWKDGTSFTRVNAVLVVGKLDPLMRFSERMELYRNPETTFSLPTEYNTSESILGHNSPRRSFSRLNWDDMARKLTEEK